MGKWEKPFESRVVGIHSSLLHNGKVLFFTYPSKENHDHNHSHNSVHDHGSAERTGDSETLDPITKESKRIILERNIFCGGSCFLEDGNLFVAGGQYQTIYSFWDPPSRDVHTFNTVEEKWIRLKDKETNKFMEMKARWYPTCLALADGKVLIISGRYSFYAINFWIFRFVNNTLQIFDPKNCSLQPPQNLPFEVHLYPFMHLLPSGKVFVHSGTISRLYNPITNTWDTATRSEENGSTEKQHPLAEYKTQYEYSRTNPGQGTCLLLPLFPTTNPQYRARIMIIGGAGSDNPVINTPATEKVETIDFGELNPRWEFTQSMNNQRVMPDAVILPNAKILVVNGSSKGKSDTAVDPVHEAELFIPKLGIWERMSPMATPRLYHAAAILLSDGRVLVSGTDGEWNKPPFNKDQRNIEIFDPPYLLHGQRPEIMTVPSNLTYDTLFDIGTTIPDDIAYVALIRPSSVTHSLNTDQRYVGLEIVSSSYSKLRVKSPPNGNIAPPGYYMLFVVDRKEIPSIAKFVHLSFNG